MNKTLQRQAILEIINNSDKHLMADEIYRLAVKLVPQITLATVYRNLKQLSEAGLINYVKLRDMPQCFEKKAPMHFHIFCPHCRSVKDLCRDKSAVFYEFLSENMKDFNSDAFSLEFISLCHECRMARKVKVVKKEVFSLK